MAFFYVAFKFKSFACVAACPETFMHYLCTFFYSVSVIKCKITIKSENNLNFLKAFALKSFSRQPLDFT